MGPNVPDPDARVQAPRHHQLVVEVDGDAAHASEYVGWWVGKRVAASMGASRDEGRETKALCISRGVASGGRRSAPMHSHVALLRSCCGALALCLARCALANLLISMYCVCQARWHAARNSQTQLRVARASLSEPSGHGLGSIRHKACLVCEPRRSMPMHVIRRCGSDYEDTACNRVRRTPCLKMLG